MNSISNLSGSPAIGAFVVNPADAPLPDREDDAAGFIQTMAKRQTANFIEVSIADGSECEAMVDGDYVTFELPKIAIKLQRIPDADLMAKFAADAAYTFWGAVYRELKS